MVEIKIQIHNVGKTNVGIGNASPAAYECNPSK